MRLPKAEQGRAALGKLYDDTMTNTREDVVGNVTENVIVASNVPCHLSARRSRLVQSATVATAALDYTVYLPVNADVIPGDALTVQNKGLTYKGVAGLPARGSLSLAVPMTGVVMA